MGFPVSTYQAPVYLVKLSNVTNSASQCKSRANLLSSCFRSSDYGSGVNCKDNSTVLAINSFTNGQLRVEIRKVVGRIT